MPEAAKNAFVEHFVPILSVESRLPESVIHAKPVLSEVEGAGIPALCEVCSNRCVETGVWPKSPRRGRQTAEEAGDGNRTHLAGLEGRCISHYATPASTIYYLLFMIYYLLPNYRLPIIDGQ